MAEPILKEKEGDVTTIILNRPEAGNRQTDATWAEVTKMLDAAAQDSRVILFKGAGDDFCLGREAMGQPGPILEAYGVRDRSETIFNLYGAFRNAKVFIVGVVQGRAVGLGCALAALCISPSQATELAFNYRKCLTASCRPSPCPRWSIGCRARPPLIWSTQRRRLMRTRRSLSVW